MKTPLLYVAKLQKREVIPLPLESGKETFAPEQAVFTFQDEYNNDAVFRTVHSNKRIMRRKLMFSYTKLYC